MQATLNCESFFERALGIKIQQFITLPNIDYVDQTNWIKRSSTLLVFIELLKNFIREVLRSVKYSIIDLCCDVEVFQTFGLVVATPFRKIP